LDIVSGWLVIAAALAIEAVLIWRGRQQKDFAPAVLFGACLLTAAPYSGVIAPYVMFAEHYLYLPLAFGIAALASESKRWASHRFFPVIFAVVAVIFAGITFSRAGLFYDNGAAFGDAVAKYPNSVEARMTLGEYLNGKGQFEQAAAQYGEVIRITGGKNEKAWNNLGDIHFRNGSLDKALGCFERAGKSGRKNLAVTLIKKGEYEKALGILNDIIRDQGADSSIETLMKAAKQGMAQGG